MGLTAERLIALDRRDDHADDELTVLADLPSFPPIALGSGKAPTAPAHKSALAWGQVGESKTIIGTGAKASDSAGWERSTDVPSPFAGRPVLSTPDPELEAEAARRRFEEVREARKEWDSWPASMYRRLQEDYRVLCEQQAEQRARDAAEQRRKAELARDEELQAAIQAKASPPRRWWQWWQS